MSGNFRKSDGGGLIGNACRDGKLIIARVLSSRDWERPKDIQRARHMAHDGASLAEIAAALGWDCRPATARRRLRKYNIRWRNVADRAHRGEETGLPHSGDGVNQRSYRPRVMGAV